jgi:aspartate aminotransferase
MQLSQRVNSLAESATLAVSSKAAKMAAQGIDVVAYGAGEPDFDTPVRIKEVAKHAIDAGRTKYASKAGLPETRQAVCTKFKRDNGLTYDPKQVIITCGGKEALFLAFATLLDPGDEVLLPVPYWVSFPEQIRLAGGVVKPLEAARGAGFKLTPDQIKAAINSRTRILVFNTPSNPGGFTYTPDETRAIAQALHGTNVMVFADEMYDQLILDGSRFQSFAGVSDDANSRTITFNAVSKSYAMTGWRVGYAAGPQAIIDGMAKMQSHTTSGPATFNQVAAADALTGDQGDVARMRDAFARRGAHMYERVKRLPGVTVERPTGAYYCFPDVTGTYARLGVSDSVGFATAVLEQAHVALVPGIAFGSDRHVRLSFACPMEHIDNGLDRLERLLS